MTHLGYLLAGWGIALGVLGAYAVACPQVGYVQGLNFIAGCRPQHVATSPHLFIPNGLPPNSDERPRPYF